MRIYYTQLARLILSGEHHKRLFLLHSRGSTGTEVGQAITNCVEEMSLGMRLQASIQQIFNITLSNQKVCIKYYSLLVYS